LAKAGYVTAEVLRDDEAKANCLVFRQRKGSNRVVLVFRDGECVLQHWHSGRRTICVRV
jgi:hypothetical protein